MEKGFLKQNTSYKKSDKSSKVQRSYKLSNFTKFNNLKVEKKNISEKLIRPGRLIFLKHGVIILRNTSYGSRD